MIDIERVLRENHVHSLSIEMWLYINPLELEIKRYESILC